MGLFRVGVRGPFGLASDLLPSVVTHQRRKRGQGVSGEMKKMCEKKLKNDIRFH